MKRKSPPIRQYMSRIPVEAERCATIAEAHSMMQRHMIHHIPVMSGSHLQGLASYRDLLEAHQRFGDAADTVALEEICQRNVLTVRPLQTVQEVAELMLQQHTDCAVVLDGGFVVGVFTTTDALRVLNDLLS